MRFSLWVGTLIALTAGCGTPPPPVYVSTGGASDAERVRSADVSILFVGNSHTSFHDLPTLVGELIRFRHPEKVVYSHVIGVGFLEDLAANPAGRTELDTRPWKHVVLQAQKESRSGKHEYSTAEGVAFARQGKERGAAVCFYAEWGVKDVPDHTRRIEAVYRRMAEESGAGVAPVGRAWELALAERPELELYSADGNHQTAVGAFLTACVLVGRITGESPADLGAFPYQHANEADRKFLAAKAAAALAANE